MTKKPKRVMTKASKAGCRSAGGLRRKLGEDFLAHLNRYWELHGREILARVWAERPELYFKALVKLTLALHRATGEPTDFDRRRNREEVLRRLEARIADARTLPEQLKAGHEPGRSTKTDVPRYFATATTASGWANAWWRLRRSSTFRSSAGTAAMAGAGRRRKG
jgi:hypothetical protein